MAQFIKLTRGRPNAEMLINIDLIKSIISYGDDEFSKIELWEKDEIIFVAETVYQIECAINRIGENYICYCEEKK